MGFESLICRVSLVVVYTGSSTTLKSTAVSNGSIALCITASLQKGKHTYINSNDLRNDELILALDEEVQPHKPVDRACH